MRRCTSCKYREVFCSIGQGGEVRDGDNRELEKKSLRKDSRSLPGAVKFLNPPSWTKSKKSLRQMRELRMWGNLYV